MELFEFGNDRGKGQVTFVYDVGGEESQEKLIGTWKIEGKSHELVLSFHQRWEGVEDYDEGETVWSQDHEFTSKIVSFKSVEDFKANYKLCEEDE